MDEERLHQRLDGVAKIDSEIEADRTLRTASA